MEISAVAVIDVTQNGAYILSVEQTPPTQNLKRLQKDATRVDQAVEQFKKARKFLPPEVKYVAVDGWYAKRKYVDAVVAENLQIVTKLQCNADMSYRYM